MCKDNISKEGAATASAASSPEIKRSSSMSQSSAVNNPKSPDENSDDHVSLKNYLKIFFLIERKGIINILLYGHSC